MVIELSADAIPDVAHSKVQWLKHMGDCMSKVIETAMKSITY